MTDYSVLPITATGDWIDAAWINQYLRDNFRAAFVGAAAGDMEYYTSAVAKAAISAEDNGDILSLVAGIPAWRDPKTLRGAVTTDELFGTSGYSYGTSTERDVPSSSLTVDIPATATVIVHGSIVAYCSTGGKHGSFWVNVGGVNYDVSSKIGTPTIATAPLIGIFENVPAGTVEVKLREMPVYDGNNVNVDQWAYIVDVIIE